MTRAPLSWRLLSTTLGVVETGAVLAIGAVIVVRALARGARPADDLDNDCDGCDESGSNDDKKPSEPLVGGLDNDWDSRTTTCPHANVRRDLSRPGFARCEDCGETDFPATPEAAGTCPACGEYGDCECVPAGPCPHCAAWVVLPSGMAIGMSPFGDPLTGGEA